MKIKSCDLLLHPHWHYVMESTKQNYNIQRKWCYAHVQEWQAEQICSSNMRGILLCDDLFFCLLGQPLTQLPNKSLTQRIAITYKSSAFCLVCFLHSFLNFYYSFYLSTLGFYFYLFLYIFPSFFFHDLLCIRMAAPWCPLLLALFFLILLLKMFSF